MGKPLGFLYAAVNKVADVPVSVHEWSETVSVVNIQWAVILALGGAIIWFVLRDRSSIAVGLDSLTSEFKQFRKDLAEKYVTKFDLSRVETKIDRHIEHSIIRHEERRMAFDAEDGDNDG